MEIKEENGFYSITNKVICEIVGKEEEYLIDTLTEYARKNNAELMLLDRETAKQIIKMGIQQYHATEPIHKLSNKIFAEITSFCEDCPKRDFEIIDHEHDRLDKRNNELLLENKTLKDNLCTECERNIEYLLEGNNEPR